MSAKFDIQTFMDAWATQDINKLLSFYAEDVDFQHTTLKVKGKSELRKFLAKTLDVLGDCRIEPKLVVQDGQKIAALVQIKGTYRKDYPMKGGGVLPLAGTTFEIDLMDMGELNAEGKIVREYQLHDNLSALLQLDLPPERLTSLMAHTQGAASR